MVVDPWIIKFVFDEVAIQCTANFFETQVVVP